MDLKMFRKLVVRKLSRSKMRDGVAQVRGGGDEGLNRFNSWPHYKLTCHEELNPEYILVALPDSVFISGVIVHVHSDSSVLSVFVLLTNRLNNLCCNTKCSLFVGSCDLVLVFDVRFCLFL